METNQLIIQYLKVFLSSQVVIGAISLAAILIFKKDIKGLLKRIARIKLPGGGEFYTTQQARVEKTEDEEQLPNIDKSDLPDEISKELNLDPEQIKKLKEYIDAEKANSYLWEYKFLNGFYVETTQRVLDWFYHLDKPTSIRFFDNNWNSTIPDSNERQTILGVLLNHYLLQQNGDMIEITPKGKEYKNWRDGDYDKL